MILAQNHPHAHKIFIMDISFPKNNGRMGGYGHGHQRNWYMYGRYMAWLKCIRTGKRDGKGWGVSLSCVDVIHTKANLLYHTNCGFDAYVFLRKNK